jgi:hypothetical protein
MREWHSVVGQDEVGGGVVVGGGGGGGGEEEETESEKVGRWLGGWDGASSCGGVRPHLNNLLGTRRPEAGTRSTHIAFEYLSAHTTHTRNQHHHQKKKCQFLLATNPEPLKTHHPLLPISPRTPTPRPSARPIVLRRRSCRRIYKPSSRIDG